jgi:hypothetical protein
MDDGGGFFEAWADATTVLFSSGTGRTDALRLGPADVARTLKSVEPVGAHGLRHREKALARFAGSAMGHLFRTG